MTGPLALVDVEVRAFALGPEQVTVTVSDGFDGEQGHIFPASDGIIIYVRRKAPGPPRILWKHYAPGSGTELLPVVAFIADRFVEDEIHWPSGDEIRIRAESTNDDIREWLAGVKVQREQRLTEYVGALYARTVESVIAVLADCLKAVTITTLDVDATDKAQEGEAA